MTGPGMRHSLRRAREDGNAIVISILVVAVCLSLSLVGVQLALNSTRASGVDRQRVVAVDAAEAGVDSAYSALRTAGATLPCTLTSGDVRSSPDTAGYDTTLTYYDSAGTDLRTSTGCVSGTPASALIRSTARTQTLGGGGTRGQRTMEALVTLAAPTGDTMPGSLYSGRDVIFSNQATITGNSGADADIYATRTVSCVNNVNLAGSFSSQGGVVLSNGCAVAGNVWAKAGVSIGPSSWTGSIGGFVKSASSNIALSSGTVSGSLYAAGTIAHRTCPARCFPGSSPGDPPSRPFPILRGDTATTDRWKAGSATLPRYNVVLTDNSNCGNIGRRIADTYAKAGTPTLLRTTCRVALDRNLPLSNDLAIFAYGGITTSTNIQVTAGPTGTQRRLHLVVPYDAAATIPCSSPVFSKDGQFTATATADVQVLMYSPCDIAFRNQTSFYGQAISGSDLLIQNSFTMNYRPVPVLGVDPTSLPVSVYNPSLVYKRETR